YHWEWRDDFSAARNESIRHARGKWIFWMDTDDEFPEHQCGRLLRRLAQTTNPRVWGFIGDVHCPGAGGEGSNHVTVVQQVKMFRNYAAIAWERRLHEQILMPIRRAGGSVARTRLFLIHSGYDHSPEGQLRKKDRDFRLLNLELKERPSDPF